MVLSPFSRLCGQRVSNDEVIHWEWVDNYEFPISTDDHYYEWKSTDRIDLVAIQFYHDPNLSWVILNANNIGYPPKDLQPGMKIRIPQYLSVINILDRTRITASI
jgi:hypothetical protein